MKKRTQIVYANKSQHDHRRKRDVKYVTPNPVSKEKGRSFRLWSLGSDRALFSWARGWCGKMPAVWSTFDLELKEESREWGHLGGNCSEATRTRSWWWLQEYQEGVSSTNQKTLWIEQVLLIKKVQFFRQRCVLGKALTTRRKTGWRKNRWHTSEGSKGCFVSFFPPWKTF